MADSKTKKYEALKLENQLCFPLYACAKEVVRKYKPYLDKINLTYTQYIALMVLWEKGEMTVSGLGDILYLDSGTLTPLLKKMETKGLLVRKRDEKDERVLRVSLTKEGVALREKACDIPGQIASCVALSPEEGQELYRLLYKILASM